MQPKHLATAILAVVPPLAAQAPTQFVTRTPLALAAYPLREVAIGDFDGDGDLDLCGGRGLFAFGPKTVLLRNDGQERFTDVTATNLPTSTATGDTLLTVPFDMDGDGDLDLFVSKQSVPSRLLENDGTGVFSDVTAGNLPPTAINHYQVAVADFDGDGDLDLACARSFPIAGGLDRLFVNDGTGGFQGATLVVPPDTLGLVATDFDGDGDADLVAGSGTGPVFLRNDQNLVFTDVTAAWIPATGVKVQAIAVGDLDGDGDPDLVCGRAFPGDLVLINTGVSFVQTALLPNVGAGTKSVVLCDFDEDGDLDLVRSIVQAMVPLAFELNDGTGMLTPAPGRLPQTGAMSARVFAFDVDRDGDAEILQCEEVGLGTNNSLHVNRHRDLTAGPATIGQPFVVEAWSEPGYATLHHTCRLGLGVARLPVPLPVPGFGELWIDLGAGYVLAEDVVLANAGRTMFSFLLPQAPALVGLELHLQAVLEQARAPARFTAWRSVVVQ